MHPSSHLCQQAAEGRGRAIPQCRRILPLQHGIDVRRGHQAGTLFARLGEGEAAAYKLLSGSGAVKRLVRLLDFRLLFLAEPATFPVIQLMQKLGVQLVMVNRRGAVDGLGYLRRLPERSVSRSRRLLVPMNEAMRGSGSALRL